MAKQRSIIKYGSYGAKDNTCTHFARTYNEVVMRQEQFERACQMYKRIVKNVKRTTKGAIVTLTDGQQVQFYLRG